MGGILTKSTAIRRGRTRAQGLLSGLIFGLFLGGVGFLGEVVFCGLLVVLVFEILDIFFGFEEGFSLFSNGRLKAFVVNFNFINSFLHFHKAHREIIVIELDHF